MKKLLIVVDYQVDFVDGALGFEGAELLDEPIAHKIEIYRAAGDSIFFLFDTHRKDYANTLEGKNLPVPHCIEGTPGHELYGKVGKSRLASDPVFFKPTFGSVELFERLVQLQRMAESLNTQPFESIELVGLVSNICVIANAVIARTACPETPIIVDAACTASFDEKLHAEALDVLEGLQISVINRT